jgi:hypothetical protein
LQDRKEYEYNYGPYRYYLRNSKCYLFNPNIYFHFSYLWSIIKASTKQTKLQPLSPLISFSNIFLKKSTIYNLPSHIKHSMHCPSHSLWFDILLIPGGGYKSCSSRCSFLWPSVTNCPFRFNYLPQPHRLSYKQFCTFTSLSGTLM